MNAKSVGAEGSQRIGIAVLHGFRKDCFGSDVLVIENASDPPPAVGLFELPRHLMEKWEKLWKASSENTEGIHVSSELFGDFARAVIEFLQFKRVHLPAECRCNLLAVPPVATRLEATKPQNPEGHGSTLLAINLGPEVASARFIVASATGCGSEKLIEETGGKLADGEVQLEPGQGYMLHGGASVLSKCAGSGSQPGMFLLIESN